MSRARGSMGPPVAPEGEELVRGFARMVRRVLAQFSAQPPDDRATRAQALARLAAEIYAGASNLLDLELPDELAAEEEPETTLDVPIAADWADLGGGDRYTMMVEPFGDGEPATASLRDDLEEVLAELAAGLAILDDGAERWPAAALEWRMAFVDGWGRNLAAILYAAHCAIGAA